MKKGNLKLVRIGLISIILVEMIAISLVDGLIFGVVNTEIYLVVLMLPLLCLAYIKEVEKGKRLFVLNSILIVFIPLLFVFNLPSVTYEGGKAIVQNEIQDREVSFISSDYKLVMTTPNDSWFVKDYHYYYEIEVSGERLFYRVSPQNGMIFQLEEDFYKHSR